MNKKTVGRNTSSPGKLLVAWRAERQLTQVQLAEQIGCDAGYVSRAETGSLTPSLRWATEVQRATKGRIPAAAWMDPSFLEVA